MGVMGGHFEGIIPDRHEKFPVKLIPFIIIWVIFILVLIAYVFVTFIVPSPRKPRPSEKTFKAVDRDGNVTDPEPLPCWYDRIAEKYAKLPEEERENVEKDMEPAEVFMTVIVPAFNEEERLVGMLEETVTFLQREYGGLKGIDELAKSSALEANGNSVSRKTRSKTAPAQKDSRQGWEIIIVDDGSTDDTLRIAETFSRTHILSNQSIRRMSGPWSHRNEATVKIPPRSIRMVSLEQNRGKGGAVTHGMRHARGQYVVFADADGASKFEDLGKLVTACQGIEDAEGRGVAVGSRAHLVGSEAVVKRSKLRNFLMHSFHLLLRFMTPPKTGQIRDTQCGFKLFSRPALPYIVPYMHSEGWIFDVEMLMLAEFAGIPVVEVAIGWREVMGSKLNVIKDSIGMAWGLAILRICWSVGVFRR